MKIKPKIEEFPETIKLLDSGLTFSKKEGEGTFGQLRKFDYGPGFRMSTIPELVQLFYACFENERYSAAYGVRHILEENFIAGNTAIHYFPEGMFAEDNPKLTNGRIVTPNRGKLEKRLGRTEESGVVFSNDRLVRFVPYGFRTGLQPSLGLAKNPGIVALVGSEENAERLERVAGHYDNKYDLYFSNNKKTPKSGVVVINSRPLNKEPMRFVLLDQDTPAVSERENPYIINIDAAAFEHLDGFGAAFGVKEFTGADEEEIIVKKEKSGRDRHINPRNKGCFPEPPRESIMFAHDLTLRRS